MFDVLKTLSGLIKAKPARRTSQMVQKKTVVDVPKKPQEKKPIQQDFSADVRAQAQAAIAMAQAEARGIIIDAKDQSFRMKREAEDEIRKRGEILQKREGAVEEREKHIRDIETTVEKKLSDVERLKQELTVKLEKASRMTHNEAQEIILNEVREKMKQTVAKEIKDAKIRAEEEAEGKAREILVDAMRHGATEYVAEYTVSVIKIPDEDVKGRIIGKEGRNIRAFETATGVDVDLDEEGVIRLSCFDPVRREIARVALERLLKDGRVQPGRIEEIIEQVKKEIERIMFEEGQKLCHAVGVYNLPSPIVALLGRFKYRSSYGQNMISHTLEETKIGIALAREVGSDANVVRLGCLLHDIGKVITDKEGSHVELGVELLKKYGLPKAVIDCVSQHH